MNNDRGLALGVFGDIIPNSKIIIPHDIEGSNIKNIKTV